MAISAGDAVVELGLDTKKLESGLKGVTGKLDQASAKWGRKMKIAGGVMVGAIAAVGGTSLKMAADFDSAMREVNTMMLLNEEEFASFSKEVRGLAADMGVDAVEAANALYQAISAGVPKGNAIEFLEIATMAAIGGVTDTATAVDGLTTVINAFKIPISDAEKVADIMFTTVKGGKTTMEELSASLFQVAPIAAASGIKFEEVSAALATMTKQGVPTSVATTQLRQAMVMLQKPTADMKKVLGDLGYESGQAMIDELGLAETLNTLRDATGGNTEMLNKMFSSSEAVAAVLALTGDNAQMFTDDLLAMADAEGAAQDAADQMEKTVGRKFETLQAKLKDTAMTLGTALMPMLIKLMEIITPIIEKIAAWIEEHPKLATGILIAVGALGGLLLAGGFLLPMVSSLITFLPMLGGAFTAMLGPIGLIVLAIAAVIAIGVLLYKHWDEIAATAKLVWGGLVGFFESIPIKIGKAFSTLKDIILAPFRFAISAIETAINWLIKQINKISIDIPDWVPGGGKRLGFDIPEVRLPTFDKGGTIPESTLLYGLKSMRPYATAKQGETISPATQGITNHFNISQLVVREEADIGRIARELLLQQQLRQAHG